jgi:hypothetical protein
MSVCAWIPKAETHTHARRPSDSNHQSTPPNINLTYIHTHVYTHVLTCALCVALQDMREAVSGRYGGVGLVIAGSKGGGKGQQSAYIQYVYTQTHTYVCVYIEMCLCLCYTH